MQGSVAGLPNLLLYTNNLKCFNLYSSPIGADILGCLVQLFKSQLLDLHVTIGHDDTALQLALVGRFLTLRHLGLDVYPFEDGIRLADADVPPFEMPMLHSLEFNCLAGEGWKELMKFVGRGHFPALEILILEVDISIRSRRQSRMGQTLRPLLENVGQRLRYLDLSISEANDAAQVIFPLLTTVQEISVLLVPASLNIGSCIPTSTMKVNLQLDRDWTQLQHSLFRFLDDLHSNAKQSPLLRVVQLLGRTSMPFLWRTILSTHATTAEQLIIRSVTLQEDGIQLQDQSGESYHNETSALVDREQDSTFTRQLRPVAIGKSNK
ncbi:hypothetical protein CALCODRAFT_498990 [Calocera cornea HHB12733]|uniref:F-box domain-containing protein n=1 Tax=Calocera cornea HHB12733 TaxID=1353952 RepID=A0A165EMM6_9BASI|nr:hypothetical protein CALCODRAFT_498990 [Calocera cornea HHB12733]